MKALLLPMLFLIFSCTTEPIKHCTGMFEGYVEDDCGVCDNDTLNDNTTCEQDCVGIWGGDAYIEDENCIVFDIDGNIYKTIQIGDQLWMAENLKVTHYNNGDEIPYPSDDDFGSSAPTYDEGEYGVYDNDPANADVYGNLYNWVVVDDDRSVCPEGMHIPSSAEYAILTDYLGGANVAGGKMKEEGHEHWIYYSDEVTEEATNESGFTGLPGGYRSGFDGHYGGVGYSGDFWSSSKYGTTKAKAVDLDRPGSDVTWSIVDKQNGFSIRCLGD